MLRERRLRQQAGRRQCKTRQAGRIISWPARRPLVVCLLVVALVATRALGSDEAQADGGGDKALAPVASRQHERGDSPAQAAGESGLSGSSSSSSQSSIVASLSSAVASAAAAAAVAAAKNSLSSSDARSLSLHTNHQLQRHHSQRAPGLNLAMKLADSIPEVPYNILHNMKKLDHAAPFYNVPNKMSPGAPKESSQSFLSSALAQATSSGAADQLGTLFRSPLWKRIADGYGDFASEFRSLFRAPAAAPMKAPTGSSASKLLRDISLPALLMLVASSISGDWRPVRTRRKSALPVEIPLAPSSQVPAFLSAAGAQNFEADYKAAATLQDPLMSDASTSGASWASEQALSQQQQQQRRPLARDFNLQPSAALDQLSWQHASPMSGQDPNRQAHGFQLQQQVHSAPLLRRADEMAAPAGTGGPDERSPFSSFTSTRGDGRLIASGELFNANNNGGEQFSKRDGPAGPLLFGKLSPIKRDQLSDTQRHSLIEPADAPDSSPGQKFAKVSLLSSMAHAVGGLLRPSSAAGGGSGPASRSSLFGSPTRLQTINHEDEFARRQPQSSAEQRDLTKLLPESWRELVKRTMSTVQQQANSQWKSIEGQLTNWVQDKLKTVGSSPGAPASQAVGTGAPAPVANMLTSMSSTALNILGLNKQNTSASSSGAHSHTSERAGGSQQQQSVKEQPASGSESVATSQRGKLAPSKGALVSALKSSLAGANHRLVQSSHSSTTSSPPLSLPTLSTGAAPAAHPKVAADELGAAPASLVSNYPTLVSGDQANQKAPAAAHIVDSEAAGRTQTLAASNA